jgi:hypothetical protein
MRHTISLCLATVALAAVACSDGNTGVSSDNTSAPTKGGSSSAATGGTSHSGSQTASGGKTETSQTSATGGTQQTSASTTKATDEAGGQAPTGGKSGSTPSSKAVGGSSNANGGASSGSMINAKGGASSAKGGAPAAGGNGPAAGGTVAGGGKPGLLGGASGGPGLAGGTGGRVFGGMPGIAGTPVAPAGGSTTTTASAGAPPTGTGGSSGTCEKGKVKAQEVVIMGESFYAMDPKYIEKRIEEKAKAAGAIGSGDSYRNVAVSGQSMSYIATTEWDQASKSSVKFVIMDGGGIDCMQSDCPTCPDSLKSVFAKMATAGVTDVIYTRYPEPGAPPGSNASLKGHLDALMPKMQAVCEASTAPKCHWVDLRPVFVAGDTTDGLHPTQSGGEHVGDLIWSEMVKDCLAQ